VTSWDGTDTGQLKLRRGFFGQVQTLPNGTFSVELRGVLQHLAHTYTKLYTATCLYDLGETDCGVPINPLFVARSTAYVIDDHVSADPVFNFSPIKAGDVFKLPIIGPSFEGLNGNLSNSVGWYSLSGASLVLGVPSPEGAKDGADAIQGGTTDGTIAQDIDLLAAGVTAANIDAGNIYMSLFGWRIGDNADTGQLVFQGLDSKLNVINTIYDSTAETLDVTDGWVRRGDYELPIPTPEQGSPTFGTDISFTAPDIIDYNPTVGTDISFTAPDIMDSGASAFGAFQIGDTIIVSGSTSNDGTYVVDTTSAAQITFIEQTISAEGAGATITVSRDTPFGTLTTGDTFSVFGSASNDGTYEIDTITATQINTIEQTIVTEAAGAGVTLTELQFTRFVRISYSVVGTSADQYLDNLYGWLIDTNGSGRLTYTKGDVMFRALNGGTTSGTAPPEGYSYTLCDFTADGGVTWFTDISWTRAGEVTSSTGNRIFDITVLEGRGFTGWYDGGLITFETGKNAGASMEVKSWDSPGPVINPVERIKFTSGTPQSITNLTNSEMGHINWGKGTTGYLYTMNVKFGVSDEMYIWDLASLSIIQTIDLSVTGVEGAGYEFYGLDPDTGYLCGALPDTTPSEHYQFVYDPATDTKITELEVFSTPGEWLYAADTVYAFLKHAGSGLQAVMNFTVDTVRAHSFPGLIKKNEFTKSGYKAGWVHASKPGEAYGFWRNADVMLVQKYVIQADGTVTETQVGVIQAWEIGLGTFRHLSMRPRPIYDPDNDSIHFGTEMTGVDPGDGYIVGWSEANGVIYSTFVDFNQNQISAVQSYNRIGNNTYCWDIETFDRAYCVDTVTGEQTVRSVPNIDVNGNLFSDMTANAIYSMSFTGPDTATLNVRKALIEGTRLGTIELYLSMPFNVESGDLFAIYPGCDKTNISCAVIFDNIVNMFGAPDVPGQDAILSVPDSK